MNKKIEPNKTLSVSDIKDFSLTDVSQIKPENFPKDPQELTLFVKTLKEHVTNLKNNKVIVSEPVTSEQVVPKIKPIPANHLDYVNKILKGSIVLNVPSTKEKTQKIDTITPETSKVNIETKTSSNIVNTNKDTPFQPVKDPSLMSVLKKELSIYKQKFLNEQVRAKMHKAFCSYPATSESLVLFVNKEKKTLYINGVDHFSEDTQLAKTCKRYLDHNLKKKQIFYEVVETINENTIVADVYADPYKRHKLLDFLIEHGLHKSEEKDLSNDSPFEVPETRFSTQGSRNGDFSSYCDAKFIDTSEETSSNVSNVNSQNQSSTTSNSTVKNQEKEIDPSEYTDTNGVVDYYKKHKDKREFQAVIGVVMDYGPAPYNFQEGQKENYFIKIQLATKETVLWGLNLEWDIVNSGVHAGDMIKIKKETIKADQKHKYDRNIFKIQILENCLNAAFLEKYNIEHAQDLPKRKPAKSASNTPNNTGTTETVKPVEKEQPSSSTVEKQKFTENSTFDSKPSSVASNNSPLSCESLFNDNDDDFPFSTQTPLKRKP